jgi:SAM-dependent methyltransferase
VRDDEYAIMYGVEDRLWWYVNLRRMIDAHWRRYAPPGRPRLLDVGCGTGAGLQALRGRSRAVGIDYSPAAVEFCRRRGLASTAVASALDLPFRDGSFDVLISCDVLCHKAIPDKAAALREMARVLAPAGILMLNLPAYQWLRSSHDDAVFTDRRFSRRELKTMLRRQGLTPLRATYWNTVLFPPIVAVRCWRKVFPPSGSDLARMPGSRLNGALSILLAAECAVARLLPLPGGLSIFVVARKL